MRNRMGTVVIPLAFSVLVSLSCKPPAPGVPTPDDVVFHGRSQTAILKFPERYDTSKTYALLVALHGNGGTAASLAPAFSSLARASLLLAVPDGEYLAPDGGHSWFYETRDRSLWESHDTQSMRRLVELVSEIRVRYRIGSVFVLGFSQGASLAYLVGLRNPSLVSGVLAISGYMPEIDREGSVVHAQDVADARSVKLFIARGVDDALVGRQVFTAQRDFFTSRGYAVTTYQFAGAHYLTLELLDRALRWVRENSRN